MHDTDLGCPMLCNQPGDISSEHICLPDWHVWERGERHNGFWRVNLKAVVHLKDLGRKGKKTAIVNLEELDGDGKTIKHCIIKK